MSESWVGEPWVGQTWVCPKCGTSHGPGASCPTTEDEVKPERIREALRRYDEAPGEFPEDDHVAAVEALGKIRAALSSEVPLCAHCGEPHWYNFWVPDEVWSRICPDQPYREGLGGILCVRCIDSRCAALGIVGVEGRFFFEGESVVCRMELQPGETN